VNDFFQKVLFLIHEFDCQRGLKIAP